ncbi:tubulin monoglutamylase TTLL4-like [Diprion similis]|uniref:tubulin monoglutamylase TTLL4-like n=1 Tax=Diprion similis TaxID=362088 RepID=UPI001EF79279|nr:tubulin monoglutamylase TTLL4-like [Diprion similis]
MRIGEDLAVKNDVTARAFRCRNVFVKIFSTPERNHLRFAKNHKNNLKKMLFKEEVVLPDDPKTVFYDKGNVTTSASDGVIFRCDNTPCKNDAKSERSSYVEITEYILRPLEHNDANLQKEGFGDQIQDEVPMRRSLFPFVAPYVLFHSINCTCPKLSSSISKFLKWKLSGVTPRIVIRTLRKSGYHLVTEAEEDWSGIWDHSVKDATLFKMVKSFQKLNCFPGSHSLGCKDQLWRNFSRLRRVFGKEEFGFIPETFVLPRDIGRLKEAWKRNLGERWIVKPPSSGRGQGIRVIDQWWEVPKWHLVVVQRYLTRPKLINGRKFDLRVYVLATSIDPLRVYVYSEGLVRFASVKYVDNSKNLNDRFMHLTNTSINKYSPNYVVNGNANSCYGHKWSFSTLWDFLARDNVDVKALWGDIKDIVVKTLIVGEASMCAKIRENVVSTYACYELYGFDVILDEDYKPWLLEVNTLPSLHTDSSLDVAVKAPLIRNVLNMVGYQLPANMTVFEERQLVKKFRCPRMRQDERIYSTSLDEQEKRKQSEFLKSPERANYIFAIIRDLTRDDVRQLIRYEDEITQIGDFEKVFPTSESHKYHRFFKTQRYYNLLLDAWEFQARKNRREGIERLKNLCGEKFHLETTVLL